MAKKKEVSVVRTEFKLTDEAIEEFKAVGARICTIIFC